MLKFSSLMLCQHHGPRIMRRKADQFDQAQVFNHIFVKLGDQHSFGRRLEWCDRG